MSTLALVLTIVASALGGGFVAAMLVGGGSARMAPTTQERAQAWAAESQWVSLHYGGTTEHPGPESDFPRERVRWTVLADGGLYAPNVRLEGGRLLPSSSLRMGFWTERDGGSLTFLTGGVTWSSDVSRGGATSVWLQDVTVVPPPPSKVTTA